MTVISRSILLAASLFVVSATGALAQNNNPGNTGGASGSRIATPDYPPAAGSNPALSPGRLPKGSTGVPAAENPNVPGATGQTIVPGNRSTIGADRRGTTQEKTGQTSSEGGPGR